MGTSNTFQSMQPNMKEQYAGKKKARFGKTKKHFAQKAMAEAEASRNPMKALKDKSYLNLKGKKGVAT
jgi:hypothetical protein